MAEYNAPPQGILLLSYADDLVILCSSYRGTTRDIDEALDEARPTREWQHSNGETETQRPKGCCTNLMDNQEDLIYIYRHDPILITYQML